MKKFSFVTIVLLFFLFLSCASGAVNNGPGLSLTEAIEESAKKTAREIPAGSLVAVLAFDSGSGALSEYIIEELIGALIDNGIKVVDRKNLDHVYKEQNFQMSGDVSDESALSIGKFLGASIAVTGQLTAFGDSYRYRISALNVETASPVSITRLDVRSDSNLRRMTEGGKK